MLYITIAIFNISRNKLLYIFVPVLFFADSFEITVTAWKSSVVVLIHRIFGWMRPYN
jgi:hypothetical protein